MFDSVAAEGDTGRRSLPAHKFGRSVLEAETPTEQKLVPYLSGELVCLHGSFSTWDILNLVVCPVCVKFMASTVAAVILISCLEFVPYEPCMSVSGLGENMTAAREELAE